MVDMNPKVDAFLSKASKWQAEMTQLRKIVLDCLLTEELKWGVPCYTFQKSNIVMINDFKDNCVLSFVKGALLSDTDGVLSKPGENSQAVRFIRFSNSKQITEMKSVLKAYIFEAIEVEKAGLKIDFKESADLVLVEEFQMILNKNSKLKKAFEALTPGRQRAYNLFFSAAKQSATRTTRVAKYTQQILNGKGMTDCICGMSKKQPYCDGSHKYI